MLVFSILFISALQIHMLWKKWMPRYFIKILPRFFVKYIFFFDFITAEVHLLS